ncbi:MAG: hypothetical protein U0736_26320 [Gemmataceae bacterium]
MRLMAFCTYERTLELIDARPAVQWDNLLRVLQEQGNERVPEEVLTFYREQLGPLLGVPGALDLRQGRAANGRGLT